MIIGITQDPTICQHTFIPSAWRMTSDKGVVASRYADQYVCQKCLLNVTHDNLIALWEERKAALV